MKRTALLWVAVPAVIVVIGGCSNTELTKTPESEPPSERGTGVGSGGAGANLSDGEFVHDVASKNLAEIELSRMALDKSASPEVKAFARLMIHDHGAAEDKLKSVFSGHAIDWPAQLDDKHRRPPTTWRKNLVLISIASMRRQWSRCTRMSPRSWNPGSTSSRSQSGRRLRPAARKGRRCLSPKSRWPTYRSVRTRATTRSR